MAQLLEAPTEGYEDAIVVPEINANFELKHGLINLVQNKQFFGHDKEDPHAHIRYFNKITSTMKFPKRPIPKSVIHATNPLLPKVSASTLHPRNLFRCAELKENGVKLYSLKKIKLPLLTSCQSVLRKVVLLAVVLFLPKLAQPTRAMFIEISIQEYGLSSSRVQPPVIKTPAISSSSSDTRFRSVVLCQTPSYLYSRRSFLKTSRALIDVYEGEITLRVGKEAITFNLGSKTSEGTLAALDYIMTANRIDVIDMACEEYSQEVLGFSNVISSGNPTPYYDPIVSTSSPTLTPFGDSDFLLFEEADSFLALEDDPTSPEVDPTYYDPEGDILLLEAILNSEPSPPLQGNYFPETRKDLKICEANHENSSVNEPPEVELKDLPPHLEYAFLEGDDKLPVIIAKDLKNEEKAALNEVLFKSHKRASLGIFKISRGINPEFCTHKKFSWKRLRTSVQASKTG
ncbi:hypothetical protein Tco_0122202 [Tanacetum coccineum]